VARIETTRAARAGQEPLEAFVGAIFDHGIAMLQSELTWIENTLQTLKESTMQTYDIKKDRKDLYAPKAGDFEIVEVPPMEFLMVDGRGDPNTSADYRQAVEARSTSPPMRSGPRPSHGSARCIRWVRWKDSGPQTTKKPSEPATRTPGSGRC